jgi:uncharacterized protein (TIGR03067 family)
MTQTKTILALTLLLGVAGEAEPKGKNKDGKKGKPVQGIQGVWKVESARESNGFEKPANITDFLGSVWTFGDRQLTIRKGEMRRTCTYKLNPAKKPQQIDLTFQGAIRAYEGIYAIKGDRLMVSYTVLNARPTDFSMGRGIAAIKRVIVLKRAHPNP